MGVRRVVLCGVYELALESASFFFTRFFLSEKIERESEFFLSLYSFFSRGKNISCPGISRTVLGIKIGVYLFFLFFLSFLFCDFVVLVSFQQFDC